MVLLLKVMKIKGRDIVPRPKKHRHCECEMHDRVFKPAGTPLRELERIPLQRDELEALRLCDLEGLSQEQAGQQMKISRGTVQRLVTAARKKITGALVNGAALIFEEKDRNSG